jgi:hypothetical protein
LGAITLGQVTPKVVFLGYVISGMSAQHSPSFSSSLGRRTRRFRRKGPEWLSIALLVLGADFLLAVAAWKIVASALK